MPHDFWFKFFAKDWLAERGLKKAGMSAAGLWAYMLALASQSPVKGVLVDWEEGGLSALNAADLGVETGASEKDVAESLAKLAKYGVFSRWKAENEIPGEDVLAALPELKRLKPLLEQVPQGAIYSRKMFRDWIASLRSSVGGRRGTKTRTGKEISSPLLPACTQQPHTQQGPDEHPASPPTGRRRAGPSSSQDPRTPETEQVVNRWLSLGKHPKDFTGPEPRTHRHITKHLTKHGLATVLRAVGRIHEDNDDLGFLVHIANAFGQMNKIAPYYADDWTPARESPAYDNDRIEDQAGAQLREEMGDDGGRE